MSKFINNIPDSFWYMIDMLNLNQYYNIDDEFDKINVFINDCNEYDSVRDYYEKHLIDEMTFTCVCIDDSYYRGVFRSK